MLVVFFFSIFFFQILIIYVIYMNFYHPVYLIVMMLIYNILLSVNMSIWKMNYLYSIMLILIMISGLLVIFLYFSSLISNEKVLKNYNFMLMIKKIILIIFFFMMIYLLMNYNLSDKIYWMSMFEEINLMFKLNKDLFSNIKMFYEYPFSNITILCMLYLLMCLVVIVKMCSVKNSSLRKLM